MVNKEDEKYMKLAVEQAQIAEENGDVPIGTVIVYKNQIIGRAYNQREQLQDPTAHAEIIALTQAAAFLERTYRSASTECSPCGPPSCRPA